MEPRFRKWADNSHNLAVTLEAKQVNQSNKARLWIRPLSPEEVMDKARTAITQHRGDPSNIRHLLGFFEIQFGLFREQTFRWVAENSLGYAAYLVAAMKRDPTGGSKDSKEHSLNKGCFKEYIELFPSGRIAIAMKEEQYAANTRQHTPPAQVTPPAQHLTTTEHAAPTQLGPASWDQPACLNLFTPLPFDWTDAKSEEPDQRSETAGFPQQNQTLFGPCTCTAKTPPHPTACVLRSSKGPSLHPHTPTSASLLTHPPPASTLTHPAVSSEVDDSTLLTEAVKFEEANPAAGWTHTLPEVDERWISKALFKWNAKGHPELESSRVDKLWWYPPQLHQKIRQVVAVGKMYFVASEYLACRRCKRKVISWSHGLVSQLDIGHRVQFPCILTSKLAWLGNSSSQIQRKLQECHAEVWMQETVQYLQDCKGIASAVTSGPILPMPFDPVPAMPPVPKHHWLMQVYAQDVLQRLDEIKATITSQYGRILKMDSTKKVARKLAGKSYGTATRATNVGNEHGQVIMSVLTASEGYGLGPMVEGLINDTEWLGWLLLRCYMWTETAVETLF
ncbi:ATP-dependent protease ATPase subunit HslU [Dissostichus eleginoides]|uniref:ATP-dependent protease ATPase subunit HslU n=1 Tax=Dissostichus eleginoides TaxID=100907 RepID=A0AAD9F9Z6_DISEL|nr:ATP-dependent protease ATPase subunit HslU [Dissostichus eleginoides]